MNNLQLQKIQKYYPGPITVEDQDLTITNVIIPKSGTDIIIDGNVKIDGYVEFKDITVNKLCANIIETNVFKNVLLDSIMEKIKSDNELMKTSDSNESETLNEETQIESLNDDKDKEVIIPQKTNITTVEFKGPFILFYNKEFDDVSNVTDHYLVITPSISEEYCIFYLVVYFNNGLTYCENKFYYKLGAKTPFKILSQEYINSEENKATIKFNEGNLKIDFKFNKASIKNIKIKVFYSDL